MDRCEGWCEVSIYRPGPSVKTYTPHNCGHAFFKGEIGLKEVFAHPKVKKGEKPIMYTP